MDPRTQERVEQWDSRPFSGGYDGLSDLAADDFSGAVTAAGTWLFLLNGRIVGVFDGDIEDFRNASGTLYQAPHPSLPLLCTMEERGGDTRAKYYTNDTPLKEVDSTLQDGSFTGYIELSENVLSGDYYAVYYGGRRMAAAYIGNAERLVTGEEAFERAADEVGIYEVTDVDIEVTDVPGEDEPDEGTAGSGTESTGTEPDAGRTQPEPGTDPTESAIEQIDVSSGDPSGIDVDPGAGTEAGADESGTFDVTLEESGTAETDASTDQSGITTDDADDLEEGSRGITNGEAAGSASETGTDAASEAATPAPPADTGPDAAIDEAEPEAGSTDAAAGRTSRGESPNEPTPDASSETETGTEAASASTLTSTGSPDPEAVEAAAEQLDQSGISWTAEDEEDTEPEPEPATTPDRTGDEQPEDDLEERFEEEEQWRETRSIPSIDPEKTADESGASSAASGAASNASAGAGAGAGAAAGGNSPSARNAGSGSGSGSSSSSGAGAGSGSASPSSTPRDPTDPQAGSRNTESRRRSGTTADGKSERVNQLAQRVEELEQRRDAVESKAKELAAERDKLREENEELSAQVDRLQSRIDELETELERARDGGMQEAGTESFATDLAPSRALSGTNLFVRYDSKSQPTLETAHDGQADRGDVATNLRLEHHTEFDASEVAVDGQSYEEFLTSSMAYRFVEWLTERALYEIRDTGHANGLADLYDAIPRIDRAELDATISLEDDDTEDVPDRVTFDVVAFDKRGNPLVAATLNDSRDPVTESALAELEEAASAVKANYPDLAAAIAVTSSYFEPGALEVTEQATSSGFLSRGSKLSYVNLSRKQGYHLCLVESRSEGFHMNVPEL
ncbi:hypothetical protein SAMN05444422_101686 [Halobiforma haloterrestris]|uniref:DUF7527 domain-containing protein n=1 Tax=Natronobacterium haloterrestre TaxID=148448 RepID=A0A1I1DI94_NATHA|nr:transcriptional regulator [Halobiforma haloterrestris]SFB74699.1 hypothetical protein SAMN05444422_101686 [Halobiforma haloterrestris]